MRRLIFTVSIGDVFWFKIIIAEPRDQIENQTKECLVSIVSIIACYFVYAVLDRAAVEPLLDVFLWFH